MRAARPNRAMAVKPLRATPFTALQPSQSNQQKADNLLATKPDSSIYCRQHTFGIAGGAHVRSTCPILPVRVLSQAGPGLQPLRSGSTLLRRCLRIQHTPCLATRRRSALPTRPRRALQTRLAHAPLACAASRANASSDASGFPTHPWRCCTDGRCPTFIVTTHSAMHHHRHDHPLGACLALPLVLRALRSARSAGFFTPQPKPWP